MPGRGLHKENIIKALPVWTVAVGAAILFICALLISRRLGDDRARSSPPALASPIGSITWQEMTPLDSEPADGEPDVIPGSLTQAADTADAGGGSSGFFGAIDFPREAVAVARPVIIDSGLVSSAGVLARSVGHAVVGVPSADASPVVDAAAAAPADAAPMPPPASDGGDPRREEAGRDNGPGMKCGDAVCPAGQVCCNASCGICTPPGGTCSQQICAMERPPISAACGPNTCNVGQVCCNPTRGICVSPGQTCSQTPCASQRVPITVPCGLNTCNAGQVCCNASCGICTEPGQTCSQTPCANTGASTVPCGLAMCSVGQVCCNASCGICTEPGQTCSQTPCGSPIPISVPCGLNTCNEDQVCCNPSCSICAPPGQSCDPTPCL